MAIADQVFRLQALDEQIKRLDGEVHELRLRVQRDPEIQAAEAQLSATRTRAEAAGAKQRRLEGELADIEAKIKRGHARLYGGSVVDPRELGSLERELQHHGTQRDAIEEQLLNVMEQSETLQRDLVDRGSEAEKARAQWDAARPHMEERIATLVGTLTTLKAERASIAGELDARTLTLYERLCKQGGQAVARVASGVCGVCRVALPPKDIQHARAGALVTCTNCGRILFAR